MLSRRKACGLTLFVLSIVGGLLLWELCARSLPRSIFAPLLDVASSLLDDIASGVLLAACVRSLARNIREDVNRNHIHSRQIVLA